MCIRDRYIIWQCVKGIEKTVEGRFNPPNPSAIQKLMILRPRRMFNCLFHIGHSVYGWSLCRVRCTRTTLGVRLPVPVPFECTIHAQHVAYTQCLYCLLAFFTVHLNENIEFVQGHVGNVMPWSWTQTLLCKQVARHFGPARPILVTDIT